MQCSSALERMERNLDHSVPVCLVRELSASKPGVFQYELILLVPLIQCVTCVYIEEYFLQPNFVCNVSHGCYGAKMLGRGMLTVNHSMLVHMGSLLLTCVDF